MKRETKTTLRSALLLVFIFVTMLPVFTFTKLPSITGDSAIVWLAYYKYFTSLFGLIGAILIFWQYLLGFRFIAAGLSDDFVWINKVHQLFGTWGFLLIAIHPLFALLSYEQEWLNLLIPNFSTLNVVYTFLGNIAFYIIGFIWITSAVYRNKLSYRFWYYLHLVSYIVLPLVFLHSLMIGVFLNATNLSYYWMLLIIVYLMLIIFRIFFQGGASKSRYTVVSNTLTANNIASIELAPIKEWIIPFPGQYFHIQLHPWGEAHPFSVSGFNKSTGRITFASKLAGKFTRELNVILPGKTVLIDGTYGTFTSKAHEDKTPVVLIAGGIGVTPFLDALRSLTQETYLFYSCKVKKDIAYESEIDQLAKEKPNLHIFKVLTADSESREGYIAGRIDATLFKKVLGADTQNYDYYICGPQHFMNAMKTILVSLEIKNDRIYIEEFSF